ncbi:MAG: PTS fructose-like transporter subunit IIB, partial [Rhodospirillales bacterium]
MANIIGVTACPTGIAHSLMAAEALRKVARMRGHTVKIECQGAEGRTEALTDEDIAGADVVILAADIHVGRAPFESLPIVEASTSRAIRETGAVVDEALAAAGLQETPAAASASEPAAPSVREPEGLAASAPAAAASATTAEAKRRKRIVAITACPTGIAHTFMAAEALKKAAAAGGHEIKVETQGSVGAKNQLSEDDIAAADVAIIAADTHVDLGRFAGMRLYQTSVGSAVKQAPGVIESALTAPA